MGNIFARKNKTPPLDAIIFGKISSDLCTWLKVQIPEDVSAFEIGPGVKPNEIFLTVYSSLDTERIIPSLPPSIRAYKITLILKPLQYIQLC